MIKSKSPSLSISPKSNELKLKSFNSSPPSSVKSEKLKLSKPIELSSLNGSIENIPILAVASDEIFDVSPAAITSSKPSLFKSLIANFILKRPEKKLPSAKKFLSVKYSLPPSSLCSSWSYVFNNTVILDPVPSSTETIISELPSLLKSANSNVELPPINPLLGS